MPRGRYAPSPTGWQHLGNVRTALVAWARAGSDGFVLRVEDLDRPRTVPEAVDGNLDELRWLGLDWDEGPDVGGPYGPYRQSDRDAHYRDALARLERGGRLFPCWLSRKDLREAASAPHGRTPVYGPAERTRNAAIEERKRAAGKTPAMRFRIGERTVVFDDRLHGPVRVDLASEVGDVVVRRADGLWAYQLAVTVDDAAMRIAEVVRGDDLLTSTAVQDELHRALGQAPPATAHVPLLHGPDGARLAKRKGSRTARALREAGVPAERIVGLLAWTLGQIEVPEPMRADAFADAFDLARVPSHPVRLDADAWSWLHGEGPAPTGAPPAATPDRAEDAAGQRSSRSVDSRR